MKPRAESNMSSPVVVGVDIGKEVFHLVGLRTQPLRARRSNKQLPVPMPCYASGVRLLQLVSIPPDRRCRSTTTRQSEQGGTQASNTCPS